MKVAFTSSDGEMIDQHFGQCRQFHIWEIEPESARFSEVLSVEESGEDEEDRIASRAELLRGCTIVYTLQIGGPAAAKLVANRIHPMKTAVPVPLAETVERLQQVLSGTPPPWLAKAMGQNRAADR